MEEREGADDLDDSDEEDDLDDGGRLTAKDLAQTAAPEEKKVDDSPSTTQNLNPAPENQTEQKKPAEQNPSPDSALDSASDSAPDNAPAA